MKKLLLILILLFPINVFALVLPDTHSEIVLIYDLTDDQVLLEKNSEQQANIASLTKIMTTITAIEHNPDIKKSMTITSEVFVGLPWDASVAGLVEGDNLTIEDLLYASILPSGADATQALAISTSGSVESFVEEMNKLAKSIGAENTNFVNVTGLDIDNHYSTASDVMKILKYALNNPLFKEIYCTKEYLLTNGKIVKSTLTGYTKFLDVDISKILGSKTGYTSKSGVCISVLTNINGHEVAIITLKAPYEARTAYHIVDALNLIDFLEDNYSNIALVNEGDILKKIPVNLSKIEEYEIISNKTITKFLPIDYDRDNFSFEYTGKEHLTYNDLIGSKVGDIKYYYNSELLGEEEILLNTKIEMDLGKIINEHKVIIISMFVLIILLFYLLLKLKRKKIK